MGVEQDQIPFPSCFLFDLLSNSWYTCSWFHSSFFDSFSFKNFSFVCLLCVIHLKKKSSFLTTNRQNQHILTLFNVSLGVTCFYEVVSTAPSVWYLQKTKIYYGLTWFTISQITQSHSSMVNAYYYSITTKEFLQTCEFDCCSLKLSLSLVNSLPTRLSSLFLALEQVPLVEIEN